MHPERDNKQSADRQEFKLDPADRETIERICRKEDRPRDRSLVRGLMISSVRRLFAGRHGKRLPDNDTSREHLLALLRLMADINRIKTETLAREAAKWAPRMSKRERAELVHTAQVSPRLYYSDTLGRILGLVDAEREQWKLWAIWPIDLSLAESKLRLKGRDRAQHAAKRLAAGARPHAKSLSQTKPWKADGISRRTWERRRKAGAGRETRNDANSSELLKRGLLRNTTDEFASPRSPENQPALSEAPRAAHASTAPPPWDGLVIDQYGTTIDPPPWQRSRPKYGIQFLAAVETARGLLEQQEQRGGRS